MHTKRLPKKALHLLGDFDPNTPPPKIAAIADQAQRPLFSVMIPTFNCANYLEKTLQGVLAQDMGSGKMHIEVVDDCSTKDDPEEVVRRIGKGRVDFHRKDANAGATPNFNTCIERSRGDLVHILHGDDYVLPGFYQTIENLALRSPDCALYATRSFFVDEENIINHVTSRLPILESGSNDISNFLYNPALQFAGVVVRRSFFESEGGFNPTLVHCADWDMWTRAISKGSGIVSPEVLSAYRVFLNNDTGRLARTGENLIDRLRMIHMLANRYPRFPFKAAVRRIVSRGHAQEERFRHLGDFEAAEANRSVWQAMGGISAWVLYLIRAPMKKVNRLLQ